MVSTSYISLSIPQNYEGEFWFLDTNDNLAKKKAGEVKHDYTILASFPNLISTVTLYQVDKEGGLALLGSTFSIKNSTYIVIFDYAQTQTIQIPDTASKLNYYALIGIGVRMVARLNTKDSGINLSNLIALGMAASNKKLTGSLEVWSNGISSHLINGVIPVTTDLSPASISNALQAVATVKSHIYDKDTKITPQFLAFSAIGSSDSKNNLEFKTLLNKVKSFCFQ
jgi:hypothetical protein